LPQVIGQRDAYFDTLYEIFKQDKNCVLITADNGAPSLDKFHIGPTALPGQFYTVGIAEAQMMGMAAGLAFEGKKVWVYAIAPFVTTHVHEFVKLDICAMNLPVTILGVGAGFAYDIMGPSHHTVEDISIMRCLPNLSIYSPADAACARWLAGENYRQGKPAYVRFDRTGLPDIYTDQSDFSLGMSWRWGGKIADVAKLAIVTTGVTAGLGMRVKDALTERAGVTPFVVDVFKLKPIDNGVLRSVVDNLNVVVYEEHYLNGGLGSIIAELMVDGVISPRRLLRIGVPDEFTFIYGGREAIWKHYGLDVESVTQRILNWLI
jgi:transketolase